jgi:hypothetical protein
MTGFISTLITTSLNYSQYSDIADLHTLQFTVAHALGFSVFTSRLLVTALNTEISSSKHYKVYLPFLVQSLWNSTALNTELPVAVSYRELTWMELHLKLKTVISVTVVIWPPHRPRTENTVQFFLKEDHRQNESRDSYLASPLARCCLATSYKHSSYCWVRLSEKMFIALLPSQ